MNLDEIKTLCSEMAALDPSKRVTMNDMARACEFAPKAAAALKLAMEALEQVRNEFPANPGDLMRDRLAAITEAFR